MTQRPIILTGVALLLIYFSPYLTVTDPMQTNTTQALQPPTHEHLLGTDLFGRDIFSRFLHGGQRTVTITLAATLVATGIGLCAGLAAGSTIQWLNSLIIISLNALLAFPGILLALITLTLLGRGPIPLAIGIGITQIAPFARVTRSAVLSTRTLPYIEAARAMGASKWQIVRWHILPSIRPTTAAYIGVTFTYCLINSAALSFLGLGGEPGIPDWGSMLAEGRYVFRAAPWLWVFPGIAISLLALAINTLADHLTQTHRITSK